LAKRSASSNPQEPELGIFAPAFIAFLIMGVPITLVLAIAAAIFVIANGQAHLLAAFPQRIVAGVDQFILLTVPLFILAGNLMNAGNITDRIIRFCQVLVGRFRGGLGLVNVMASMLFAGVSGSATADAAALGTILIPGMEKEGYDRKFAAGLTAVASVIGPIIPPSLQMIVFAVLSGTSIAQLFIAGIVPGILIGIGLMIYAVYVAHKRKYPKEPPAKARDVATATYRAFPVLLLPVIILGGILGGVFTPTEAAAVASLYSLIIAGLFYRTLKLSSLTNVLYDTCLTTSAIMLVVAMASIVSFVFSIAGIPEQVVGLINQLTQDRIAVLLLINVALLILGMFLEPIGAMILTTPILLPLAQSVGIDPVHLAMVVVLNLVIGLATPPVGLCLFIACSISKESLASVSRAAAIPISICIGVLLLVTFVPELVLFLPRLAGY